MVLFFYILAFEIFVPEKFPEENLVYINQYSDHLFADWGILYSNGTDKRKYEIRK